MGQNSFAERQIRDFRKAQFRISRAKIFRSKSLDLGTLMMSGLPDSIADLNHLKELNLSGTVLTNIDEISALRRLEVLDFSLSDVKAITFIEGLKELKVLNIRKVKNVSDFSYLRGLSRVVEIDCRRTQIQDLSPLESSTTLESLNCGGTGVIDLGPLCRLTALAKLCCSFTQVSDLGPLSRLPSLRKLDCAYTQVSDLGPAVQHRTLEDLQASDLPNCSVPPEHLSQKGHENCLPRLRAYWDNLDGGAEPFRQHKLFLLGNGTVGKTQVARALMGKPFDETVASTHGIQLKTHELPAPADPRHESPGDQFLAKIWDFGGQDIYHGTHALFLKTRATFLICWEVESERAREHVIDGVRYRNRPLAYWLDYVRQFAGPNAEIILVQTKNDRPGSVADAAQVERLYPDCPSCSTSAREGEGLNRLKRLIAEAVGRIEAPALPIIPTSQRRVIDAITAARKAGTRTMDREAFAALCRECGLIGAPEHMLHFLHHTGEVFHAGGRFGDQIIVDQRWALDAIYAVFDRAHCWQQIRAERGRFTLSLLAETAWQDFSPADHEHLLAMMQQCGMAFRYIEAEEGEREAVYIAPDLLPDFNDPAVQRWYAREWDPGDAGQTRAIPVPLLHDGLVRELMVGIGKDAGLWAVYWKNGVLFHDMKTRAVAVIEARWPDPDGWAGEIVITTQRSGAAALLDLLDRHVREVAERLGVKLADAPQDQPGIADDFDRARGLRSHDQPGPERSRLTPGRGASLKPSCYVSYAWGDGTAQADANERLVDDLCEAAAARGIEIVRDKTYLASGASISAFTEEIARAETVAVLIGSRYWTRPDCFMEIYGCWTEAKQRPELFAEKIREFIFPDAGLYNPGAVQQVAEHWQAEFARCDAMRGTYRDRHAMLIAEQADSWVPQCRRIIAALQDKVRTYEGDFEAFKEQLFTELEKQRYSPDHARDA